MLVVAVGFLLAAPSTVRADDDPWTGPDKERHFAASAGIAGGGYALGLSAFDARWKALVAGGAAAIVAGAAKEGVDALGYGTPSWRDFTWDILGAAAGLCFVWLIDVSVRGHGAERPLFGAPGVVHF